MIAYESLYVALHDVLVTSQELFLIHSRASMSLGIEAPIRAATAPLLV